MHTISEGSCECGCYGETQHGPPSPLTIACHNGHTSIVELLIQNGAVTQSRATAFRALGLALEEGQEGCARMLKGELFRCAMCGELAAHKVRCSSCKMVYYCSEQHKAEHHTVVECAALRTAAAAEAEATRVFAARGAHPENDGAPAPACEPCEPCDEASPADDPPRSQAVDADAGSSTYGECMICFEDLVADDSNPESRREALPCAHLFHQLCIRSWLSRKADCPTCHTKVLYSDET